MKTRLRGKSWDDGWLTAFWGREQAIEAAVNHGWEAYKDSGDSMVALVSNVAERAYDLGRIAGLRRTA